MKTRNYSNINIFLITIFFLLFSGCVTGKQKMLDAGNEPLSNQELKALFTEKRVAEFYNSVKGSSGTVTYMPNGTQSAVSKGKTYTGTYYFDGDMYCSKMDHRKGEVRCTSWFKIGDRKYSLYKPDGSQAGTLTFE